MRRPTTTVGSALVVLCVAGLGACGGGDAGDSGQMESGEQAMAERGQMQDTAPASGEQSGEAVDVTLAPRNQSGIEGTAQMHHQGDSVRVTVRLGGLSSGESYPVHIHQGTCQEGGGVAVGLTSVQATDGTGRSETGVAAGELSMDASYFVQAHLPDGTPAACGDVPAHEGSEGGG